MSSAASVLFYMLSFIQALQSGHAKWPFGGSGGDSGGDICDENNDLGYVCSCLLYEVTCSYRDIRQLPLGMAVRAKFLDFSGNSITSIMENQFGEVTSVKKFSLSRNVISKIETGAFRYFRNLETLDLSRNKIKDLPSDVFFGLMKLQTLDLSLNNLHCLYEYVFIHSPNLQRLILGHNPIGGSFSNTTDIFYSLHRLQYIDLTNTGLTAIPKTLFASTFNLRELGLSKNLLNQVPSEALSGLKLEFLDLTNNKLVDVKSFDFRRLFSLKRLIINDNQRLREIQKYAFHDLQKLEVLECENNYQLTSIHPLAFCCHKNYSAPLPLKRLYLQQNRLNQLDEGMLNWDKLEEFDLRFNPWNCDCNMKWLTLMNITEYTEELRCAKPRKLINLQIMELEPDQMTCDHSSHTSLVTTVILLAVGIVITVTTSGYLVCRFYPKYHRCLSSGALHQDGYSRVRASKDKVELEWDNNDLGIV